MGEKGRKGGENVEVRRNLDYHNHAIELADQLARLEQQNSFVTHLFRSGRMSQKMYVILMEYFGYQSECREGGKLYASFRQQRGETVADYDRRLESLCKSLEAVVKAFGSQETDQSTARSKPKIVVGARREDIEDEETVAISADNLQDNVGGDDDFFESGTSRLDVPSDVRPRASGLSNVRGAKPFTAKDILGGSGSGGYTMKIADVDTPPEEISPVEEAVPSHSGQAGSKKQQGVAEKQRQREREAFESECGRARRTIRGYLSVQQKLTETLRTVDLMVSEGTGVQHIKGRERRVHIDENRTTTAIAYAPNLAAFCADRRNARQVVIGLVTYYRQRDMLDEVDQVVEEFNRVHKNDRTIRDLVGNIQGRRTELRNRVNADTFREIDDFVTTVDSELGPRDAQLIALDEVAQLRG